MDQAWCLPITNHFESHVGWLWKAESDVSFLLCLSNNNVPSATDLAYSHVSWSPAAASASCHGHSTSYTLKSSSTTSLLAAPDTHFTTAPVQAMPLSHDHNTSSSSNPIHGATSFQLHARIKFLTDKTQISHVCLITWICCKTTFRRTAYRRDKTFWGINSASSVEMIKVLITV